MNKDIEKNRTKNILRNICIATIVLFAGIIVTFKAFSVEPNSKNLLYSYTVSKNANYKVELMENNFFEEQTLDMNKTYISSLVNKINMTYTYALSGNKPADTKYTYKIIAETDVKYSSLDKTEKNKTIWLKQTVLVPEKEMTSKGSGYTISENFDVDFAAINNEVKNFKEQLKMPIDADLNVKLIVNSNSTVKDVKDTIAETSLINLKIDLAKDIFTVENDFKNEDTKTIYDTKEAKKHINIVLLVIGSVCILAAILLILDVVRKSIKFSKKTDYAIALNRILKNYGDIVAEIVSPVEIDNLNVIEVKDFDQLLDIEEEVRMPILFCETIPDEQGEFIIVYDNMAFRYVIGG